MQSNEAKYILLANSRYHVGLNSSSCACATHRTICVIFLPGENKDLWNRRNIM